MLTGRDNGRLVVFLGAGRPSRGTVPSALQSVNAKKRALDWLLACFSPDEWTRNIVLGYQAEEIASSYPDILSSFSASWESTGAVRSLFASLFGGAREAFVSYTDILYDKDAVSSALKSEGDIVALVDSLALERYEQRTRDDLKNAEWLPVTDGKVAAAPGAAKAEFVGLALFRKAGIDAALKLWEKRPEYWEHKQIGAFLTELSSLVEVRAVDLLGNWAEQNAPQDVARYVLGTKAHTLSRLSGMIKKGVVPDHYTVKVADWRAGRRTLVKNLQKFFHDRSVAVRSSCKLEDTWQSANAGKFTSILDVPAGDSCALQSAVDKVIESYGQASANDEVLVQTMVQDAAMSGVVFTRSLERGAPYFVINYDTSGKTDVVTGGTAGMSGNGASPTLLVRKSGAAITRHADKVSLPPAIPRLLEALEEVIALAGHDTLDIEFVVDGRGTIFILQVRPIAVDHAKWRVEDHVVHGEVESCKEIFRTENALRRPRMCGSSAMFSVMTDWNPAEIIGVTPGRLAFSLYRHIITDEIWARQRAEFGYRDIRPAPLIRLFGGHPYVDVRASFSSFIPARLPDSLAERLVDHYLGILGQRPYLHDKVELDIVLTCLSFDWEDKAGGLKKAGFGPEDVARIYEGLREISAAAPERLARERQKLEELERDFAQISAAGLPALANASWLLAKINKGTLCFSHMARLGFVAVTLLRSAAGAGLITPERRDAFMRSLHTVSGMMRKEAWHVRNGALSWDEFINKYGHLRPGTYEISVPCYAAEPEKYLGATVRDAAPFEAPAFEWTGAESDALSGALDALGLPGDWAAWDAFCRASIEGREFSKFIFSRLLSKALEDIALWGAEHGCDRAGLSHLSVTDILAAQQGQFGSNAKSWLPRRIREGEEFAQLAACVELPPFIAQEADFDVFYLPDNQPNFIGSTLVIAPATLLAHGATAQAASQLRDSIALIPQADPGYDWLFGHKLKGLVTCYGGANSHMAIRAAELGLPAAIGIGEKLFARLGKASIIRLDPAGRRVEKEA